MGHGEAHRGRPPSQRGYVASPKGASFLPELEAELLMFPQGKTDDQVDSISQALAYKGSTYD